MDEFLFLYRAKEFSPNNVEKDKAILDKVRERFEEMGKSTRSIDEEDFDLTSLTPDVAAIIGMERRVGTLLKLQKQGIKTYNNAKGIINAATSRELTFSLLHEAGISTPTFWAYEPEEDEMFLCEPHLQGMLPAWVKAIRHDGARKGDVVYVETPLEADTEVLRLASEKVQDIVVMSHVEGDLIKVYAVTDRSGEVQFLKWFYPQKQGYTKFGEEAHNSSPKDFALNTSELHAVVSGISQTLGLQFFGIDAIVQSSGEITVIDVNDWPSYSICQNEAADYIARTILADIETS